MTSARSGRQNGAAEFTTVAMTYNLWARPWWPQRENAMRAFFTARDPDILAVQELRPESRDVLDELLPKHARVDDEFAGWEWESNIWWRADLYGIEAWGAEDLGTRSELRRLFWVRLRPVAFGGRARMLVATAHFTCPDCGSEEATGEALLPGEAERTLEHLDRLAGEDACVFMGDLNEHHHPVRLLRQGGFRDCFTALGRTSPVTSPVEPLLRPDGADIQHEVPRVKDFQFHRGPLRVRTGEVADFFFEQTSPSDHKPVIATYTLYGSG